MHRSTLKPVNGSFGDRQTTRSRWLKPSSLTTETSNQHYLIHGCLLITILLTTLLSSPSARAMEPFYFSIGTGITDFSDAQFSGDGLALSLEAGVQLSGDHTPLENAALDIGLAIDLLLSTNTDVAPESDLDVSINSLYLRQHVPVNEHFSAFGQLGYSYIDIEDYDSFCYIFNCIDITYYSNSDRGASWGLGLTYHGSDDLAVSIGFYDYSLSEIEAQSWLISFRSGF